MATDFEGLGRRLETVASQIAEGTEKLMSEIISEIGKAIVTATPVDTGFARANWRPSLNAPATSPVSFLDPTGTATISKINTIAKQWRLGEQAFITNQAPYIGRLNQGSSPQAPADFVRTAVERGLRQATVGGRGRIL